MWNKYNVVMLPTNEKAKIGQLAILDNRLITIMSEFQVFAKPQHLYITSDEEIEDGDWYLWYDGNKYSLRKYVNCKNLPGNTSDSGFKIIATTDTSLELPLISQQFIEKYIEEYNKGNVIKEVLVEYEGYVQSTTWEYDEPEGYRVKINSNNTINIKPIKNSWSREEVIEFVYKVLKATGKEIKAEMVDIRTYPHIIFTGVDEWIEKNL